MALDLSSLNEALSLVSKVAQVVARVEIGTPLILSAGLAAVESVRRSMLHPIVVVADVKICDAGERIARSAFAAGADVVTAVAGVIDDVTWQGVLKAAKAVDHPVGSPSPILLDTVGHGVDLVVLEKLCATADREGIPVDLCIHRPKSGSRTFAALIAPFAGGAGYFDRLIVAGKLSPAEVHDALTAGFDTLIVGGAVADAADPLAIWNAFRSNVDSFHQGTSKNEQSQ
ncbi:MAG TPA: orotidine 5'-phosphate decarboxylase / HUMPS family protein [Candidatus Acidoferrum sp.]|nr:orotidine 5'-phosphate decarboxylase / HUMPS family protein [Candidatus Acidoferrum sp.]